LCHMKQCKSSFMSTNKLLPTFRKKLLNSSLVSCSPRRVDLYFLYLQIKVLLSFEKSVTVYWLSQREVQKELRLQQHRKLMRSFLLYKDLPVSVAAPQHSVWAKVV
jgi:hypothetical protein